MPLPSIYIHNRGFTLIEILIVLSIFGVLAALGVIAGLDSLSRYNFHAETDNAIALLQKARSESINNIAESQYGVYFADANNLILFKGAVYGANPAYDVKLAKNPAVSYDYHTCFSNQVVFAQLSGTTTPCWVAMANPGAASNTITINNEGGIDY